MTDELEPDPRRSPFVRVASIVGDFDSPFYDEERDRDVWNEASAIGFQILLWGVPLVAAASLWIVGSAALLPIGLLLALWIAAGVVALFYAQRFGVDPNDRTSLISGRHAMFYAVLGLLGTGVVRAGLDLEVVGSAPTASFIRGMGQGMTAAAVALCLLLVVLLVRDRLRSRP